MGGGKEGGREEREREREFSNVRMSPTPYFISGCLFFILNVMGEKT